MAQNELDPANESFQKYYASEKRGFQKLRENFSSQLGVIIDAPRRTVRDSLSDSLWESRNSPEFRCSFSPLESREVHERRGRDKSMDTAASIDCCSASPVVPTDPPQAEGKCVPPQAEGNMAPFNRFRRYSQPAIGSETVQVQVADATKRPRWSTISHCTNPTRRPR